jgi:cytochrome oxidase Cu insertion factor (SCO1/SenC/PrrC family)
MSARSVLPRRRLCAAFAALALPPLARAADTGFASNFDGTSLRDQDGRAFSFQPLLGQVLLVNFVYTGCSTVCPLQTRALADVLRALPAAPRAGERFVSVALDPLQDTPAALKRFASQMGADLSRWSFVTGSPADIDRLATRLRLFKPDARRPDDHATSLWLVDEQGRLMLRLSGTPVDGKRVSTELQAMWSLRQPGQRTG